ncbi:MAG: thioredoxin domain-containing protein [Candidatus Bathyarchaeota archaeon]|jgi:uncharacterized protein YyaL (SSP411 family)
MPHPRPNRLINEKSPYLLQHAYNPVDWHPWSLEAFEQARREDKPIFLSIGYSTCHWCHVMEKESFQDNEIAQLLNETFICIKVDREERPDLDTIYMKVCQMMTGSGGWPLTIIMTPDKKPFFATTYIPKNGQFGRVSIKGVINHINDLWRTQRNNLINSAEKIIKILEEVEKRTTAHPSRKLGLQTLDATYEKLSQRFDDQKGGFGVRPKFPTPHNLLFLLRYWKRTNNKRALMMAEKTLESMNLGGIYDQIGFGFHRYSTDSSWLVPHFEKMLYDQAMLTIAYVEAYQATKKEKYRQTVHEILTYILRDMTDQKGGFYSAEDADSEGEEGKFYLWTREEIKNVLPPNEAKLISKIFNIQEEGNYVEESTRKRVGKNILHLKNPLKVISKDLAIPLQVILETLEKSRQGLFIEREKRVHPAKDDKILSDWNGLMIAAFAKAGQVFNEQKYIKAAENSVSFILENMIDQSGFLLHRYRIGEAGIHGFLDDYSFLIWGLLELYEATFKATYLERAIALTKTMINRFYDNDVGGFFFTAKGVEEGLYQTKRFFDGAYPSGNSIAVLNMIRLFHITGESQMEKLAWETFSLLSKNITNSPEAYTQAIIALDFALGPANEVVVVGNLKREETMAMINALRSHFIPNKVVLFRSIDDRSSNIEDIAEFIKPLNLINRKPTAYVCRNYACNLPTNSIGDMLMLLDSKEERK